MRTRTLRRLTLTELGFGGAPIGTCSAPSPTTRRDARWTPPGRRAYAECARRGVQVVAAAPFNSGLLARDPPPSDATFDYGRVPSDIHARATGLSEICRRHGVPLPAAALQFPLRAALVSAVVCGLRSVGEVEAARTNLAVDIPTQAWAELEA